DSRLLNNQWYDNDSHRIEWTGGTISSNRTWSNDWDNHTLLGNVTVNDGVTLTIEAGTTILLDPNKSLFVHGNLIADGTFEDAIDFAGTSNTPWLYLRIGGGSVDGDSDNSSLRYVVSRGAERGLYIYRSTLNLEYLTLIGNSYGIYVEESSGVVIQNSNFAGNSQFGLRNMNPGQVVSATHNYWGSPTGPTHTSNPTGDGDEVSSGVYFAHWRPPVLMDGIIPFTAGRTETDNSTLSYDDSSGAYIRQYNNGRNVYF
ncbi:MAG: hypothetical protein GY796_18240, partial [Chloroflexi bacterium]|nr:hypothetical protein [Chloroflexota bacterium]